MSGHPLPTALPGSPCFLLLSLPPGSGSSRPLSPCWGAFSLPKSSLLLLNY